MTVMVINSKVYDNNKRNSEEGEKSRKIGRQMKGRKKLRKVRGSLSGLREVK